MFNSYLSTQIRDDETLNNLIESLTKFNANTFYRGIVVNNYDPQGLGRIQVRIPQLHGTNQESSLYLASNSIPWAVCGYQPMGNDSGSYLIPNVGDIVIVAFEGGDKELPIYFGSILTNRGEQDKQVGSHKVNNDEYYTSPDNDKIKDIKNDTERVVYKSLKGATIIVDDKDGNESIKIIDQSGQSIIMENTGSQQLDRRGDNLGKNPQSQIVLTNNLGDSIKITKGNIVIKSSNVIIESDNYKVVTSADKYSDESELARMILGDSNEL